MNKNIFISVMSATVLVAVIIIAYKFYKCEAIKANTKRHLLSVSYGSDKGMKYAYESWLNGLENFTTFNQKTKICGACHLTLKNGITNTDVYLIGKRTITKIAYNDQEIRPIHDNFVNDVFYEYPAGRLTIHIALPGIVKSVAITDSAHDVINITAFDSISY